MDVLARSACPEERRRDSRPLRDSLLQRPGRTWIAIALVVACAGSKPAASDGSPDSQVDAMPVDSAADALRDVAETGIDAADGESGDGPGDGSPSPDAPSDISADADAGAEADLAWVSIPAGTFEMGCSIGDDPCPGAGREEPRHTVVVPAFEMLATEVTQAQYEAVAGMNPSLHSGCPRCPVEQLNWHQAKAFCEAVGGRLPTEAEWEYAARGGTTTTYTCGDDVECLDSIAWFSANSDIESHEVAEKTPNGFGLYDMLGNVWAWTEDCWHPNYDGAPSNGEVWNGGDCSYRVVRGGSYTISRSSLRVSLRSYSFPDLGTGVDGLVCARSVID